MFFYVIYLAFNNNQTPKLITVIYNALLPWFTAFGGKISSRIFTLKSSSSSDFITWFFFLWYWLVIIVSFLAKILRPINCVNDHTDFWKLSFQDPTTPIAYGIIKLHDHIMFFLVVILFVVGYLLFSTYKNFYYGSLNSDTIDNKNRSVFGTVLPTYQKGLFFNVKERTYNINHGTTIEII